MCMFALQATVGVGADGRVGKMPYLRPLGKGQKLPDFRRAKRKNRKKKANTAGTVAAVLSSAEGGEKTICR